MRKITLILGGARSGKSVFGEKLALNKDSKPIYIFTAQSFDKAMFLILNQAALLRIVPRFPGSFILYKKSHLLEL